MPRRTNQQTRGLARRMSQSRQALNRQPRQSRLFDPTNFGGGPMPLSRTVFESHDRDAPFRVETILRKNDRLSYQFWAGTIDQARAILIANACETRAVVLENGVQVFDNQKGYADGDN